LCNFYITVKWNVVKISGQVSFPKILNDQHPKLHIKISNRISLILVFIPLLCSSHHKFLNIVSLWHSLSLSKISKVVANKTLKECSFKINFVFEILCVTNLNFSNLRVLYIYLQTLNLLRLKMALQLRSYNYCKVSNRLQVPTLVEVFIYWYKDIITNLILNIIIILFFLWINDGEEYIFFILYVLFLHRNKHWMDPSKIPRIDYFE